MTETTRVKVGNSWMKKQQPTTEFVNLLINLCNLKKEKKNKEQNQNNNQNK